MRREIIQNEIKKQTFLSDKEKDLMIYPTLLKEIEKRLKSLKIDCNQEIKEEIKTICLSISDRYKKMLKYELKEVKTVDHVFYRLFIEFNKDNFTAFDRILKKKKMKFQIKMKRGKI